MVGSDRFFTTEEVGMYQQRMTSSKHRKNRATESIMDPSVFWTHQHLLLYTDLVLKIF